MESSKERERWERKVKEEQNQEGKRTRLVRIGGDERGIRRSGEGKATTSEGKTFAGVEKVKDQEEEETRRKIQETMTHKVIGMSATLNNIIHITFQCSTSYQLSLISYLSYLPNKSTTFQTTLSL